MPTTPPPPSPPPTDPVLEALLKSPLAVAVIDRDLRYIAVNSALAQLIEREPPAIIGATLSEVTPPLAEQLEPALRRVLDEGTPLEDLELPVTASEPGRVWRARLLPLRDSSGVILTAEEIIEHLSTPASGSPALSERAVFQLRLSDAMRSLIDPLEVQRVAARLLQAQLSADRVYYAEIDANLEYATIAFDDGSLEPKIVGRHRLADFGPALVSDIRAGRTLVIGDAATDARLEPQERAAHRALGVSATLAYPLLKAGRTVSLLVAHSGREREWTFDEALLVADVAERTWETLERNRAEIALRASNEQFTRTVEDAPIPILLQAEDGEVLRVNRAWTALTGYTQGDIPTMDAWLTHAYGHGSEALRDRMQALFAGTAGIVDAEFEIVTRVGERRTWLLSASSPGRMQDGRRFAVAMASDITERQAALREASEGKALLETLIEHLPVGVILADPNGQVVMMNSALGALWRGVRDLRDPSDYRAYRAWDEGGRLLEPQDWPLSKALSTAQAQGSMELRFERFDGTRGTMQTSAVPLLGADGRVVRAVGVAIDVSEQREAQQRARANDTRLRLALDGNHMVTWQLSVATEEVTVSDNFATVYGVSTLERASEGAALIWPEDLGAHRARFDHVVREGGTYLSEFRITRPIDGRVVWIEERATALRGPHGQIEYLVGVATDITARKATEERLRRNAETFASLVQGAPFGIYVVDADFRIAQVSAGAMPTFEGVSPLIGRDLAEVQRTIWPEPFASEAISRFWHTLTTGEPYTAATTSQREDRVSVESYDWRIERTTLPDGRFGVVCYFHDVTIPKATTQRLEEVNEAQRRFVSDAAHELRAPLTAIRGNLNLLRRYPETALEERLEMLGDAEREANRLTRLITDLLSVARGQMRDEIEPERVQLHALLEGAWRGALALSEHRRFELGQLEPLSVMGNPDTLTQLFVILLENAVKYSPMDGSVRLEAVRCEDWAEVRVSNDGAGIAPDDLERVFERFYRTDRARSRSSEATGTGLGLTIARQIAERHGGRVWLESLEGQGTTAIVRLPRPPND